MNTGETKQAAKQWVAANAATWEGLRAAHLVGGITTMPEDEPFPAHKDVDIHLVFDDGSPMIQPSGPFPNIIETAHAGLLIEAGIKPISEYASADAVLANPEIAHHLTVESILYDPSGILRDLQAPVREEYARRHWVNTRLNYERAGLTGALAMLPMARAMAGASGEAQILGYSSTFIAAALCVATLSSPTTGSRSSLRARDILTAHARADLYEAHLTSLGLCDVDSAQVRAFLAEGEAAFDRAVIVRRTPHPFQHKLHAHLKPYFVESCRTLLDEGHHREALHWLTPFYHASTGVILTDGEDAEKPAAAERHSRFMAALGLDAEATRAAKFDEAAHVHESIFTFADEIIATHTAIIN